MSMASDVGGIKPGAARLTPADHDRKLHDVAQMYEQQFLQEMVKAMRGTVQDSGLVKVNQGEKIYREQLDHNYAEQWSKKGGIGLADMIYKQLIDKLGPKLGITHPIEKPQGPLKLDETSNFTGMVKSARQGGKLQLQYQLEQGAAPHSATEIKAPWAGTILGSKQINADEYLLEMLHDNGFKSQFVFRGKASPLQPQSLVQGGETIGLLSPEAKSFFWNVEPLVADGLKNRNEFRRE
jgi:peptidoglycan hydrolase FlgJ